ncbi:UrcA family protein [Hyphomonas sp.]|uniref:UrcA family protein n=1 Tax=Hyphomonas sp. TaxID=87 RepID=UPI00391B38CE
MFKSTVSVLAAVALLSPIAVAERAKLVTLTHVYDKAQLSSEDGAAELLTGLTRAAKRVCTSRAPLVSMDYTDKACAESLVVAAVRQIQLEAAEAGIGMAPSLERIALTQLASAN